MAKESTTIELGEPSTVTKNSSHTKKKRFMLASAEGGPKRGLAIFDLLLRLVTIGLTIAAAAVMYTAQETLPFFTQFFQFQAVYDDIPTFQFFLIVVSIVTAYLIFSLLISLVTIVRPLAVVPRLILLLLDTVAVTLQTAASSAAAAMVYLANEGDNDTNWLPICNQFGDFCDATRTAVIIAFMAILLLVILVIMSAIALKGN